MTEDNRPISEIFAEIGERWALAKKRAAILRDTQSAFLSQMVLRLQAEDSKMAINRAETLAKGSVEWTERVHETVEAEYETNHEWVKMKSLEMAHAEWQSAAANERIAARL